MNLQTVYNAMMKTAGVDKKHMPKAKEGMIDYSKRKKSVGYQLYEKDKAKPGSTRSGDRNWVAGKDSKGRTDEIRLHRNYGDRFFGSLKDDIEDDIDKTVKSNKK